MQILNNEQTGDYTGSNGSLVWIQLVQSSQNNFYKSCLYPILYQMKYLLTLHSLRISRVSRMHFAASNLTKSHMVTVFTLTAMVESNHHTNEPGICFLIRFGRTDLIYAFGTVYAFYISLLST